jgi:hypothetical protein
LQIGDEWFNPTTNRLYKFMVQNGTSPAWTELFTAATSNSYPGYIPGFYYQLQAPYVGRQITTAQGVFGVGVDGRGLGITVAAQTTYRFTATYAFAKLSGATSHTFALGFSGTATLNSIAYNLNYKVSTVGFTNISSAELGQVYIATAASTVVTSAIASATSYIPFSIEGTVNIAAGGTFIPQYTLSADPLGAYSTQPGSFISIYPVSAAGSMSAGAWS